MAMVDEIHARGWQVKVSKSLAEKLYEKQLKDIINISHTDWYKQIKEYWIRVKEWASIELNTIDEKNLKVIQLKRNLADDFVTFLNNLEQTKEIRQKVKT